jgi:hypothetical protein
MRERRTNIVSAIVRSRNSVVCAIASRDKKKLVDRPFAPIK